MANSQGVRVKFEDGVIISAVSDVSVRLARKLQLQAQVEGEGDQTKCIFSVIEGELKKGALTLPVSIKGTFGSHQPRLRKAEALGSSTLAKTDNIGYNHFSNSYTRTSCSWRPAWRRHPR